MSSARPVSGIGGMESARSFVIKSNRHDVTGAPLGNMYPPLLDVIIGVTPGETTPEDEFQKALAASKLGVQIVTDVSTAEGGQLRRQIAESLPVAVRTVPTYDIYRAVRAGEDPRAATIRVIQEHIRNKVDCITIHATGTAAGVSDDDVVNRVIPVTSRGGAMMNEISVRTGLGNPYAETFDEILDLCATERIALSLATTARPGSVLDALSASHVSEVVRQGELARRAHARGVNVVVELMGHVPLNLVPDYCALARKELDGAPFGALGPCVTDIAMGHDDISGAIGAAVAAMHGTSFIACLTAGEHCHLPRHDELVQSIKNFQIALHAGWIAYSGDLSRDEEMSRARNRNDWPEMVKHSLHSDDAHEIVVTAGYHAGQVCSMCGSACPIVRTGAMARERNEVHPLPLSPVADAV